MFFSLHDWLMTRREWILFFVTSSIVANFHHSYVCDITTSLSLCMLKALMMIFVKLYSFLFFTFIGKVSSGSGAKATFFFCDSKMGTILLYLDDIFKGRKSWRSALCKGYLLSPTRVLQWLQTHTSALIYPPLKQVQSKHSKRSDHHRNDNFQIRNNRKLQRLLPAPEIQDMERKLGWQEVRGN